jgi:hypothetical protein
MMPPEAYTPGEPNQRELKERQAQERARPDRPSHADRDLDIEQLLLRNGRNYRPMPQQPEGQLPPVPNIDEAWDASDREVRHALSQRMAANPANKRQAPPPPPPSEMDKWRAFFGKLLGQQSMVEQQPADQLPPLGPSEPRPVRPDMLERGPVGPDSPRAGYQRGPNTTFSNAMPVSPNEAIVNPNPPVRGTAHHHELMQKLLQGGRRA